VREPLQSDNVVDTPQSETVSIVTGKELEMPPSDEGFLSFEDWKRLNLLRTSEYSDETIKDTVQRQVREAPQPRGRLNDQAIDSIGDEIDIQVGTSAYGKTSKERFNYASFDCAAAVLKSNSEAKGSSSILDENRDRYMLNKCGASNKFVIVEMCEDILVDTIVLANFEFFSSTFKEFRVSVTDRYPVYERGWKTLGTFIGNNTRTIQVFAVENPLIWARYIRIEFLTHYGNEFYCPLTLLRVHGTTMIEEYKSQDSLKIEEYGHDLLIQSSESPESGNASTSDLNGNASESLPSTAESPKSSSFVASDHPSPTHSIPDPKKNEEDPVNPKTWDSDNIESSTSHAKTIAIHSNENTANSTPHTMLNDSKSIIPSPSHGNLSFPPTNSSETGHMNPSETISEGVTIATGEKADASAGLSSSSPTTQESVYKTITKRLGLLEANATLSLRYIEEQSQLLRDVFNKMERRHLQKIDSFLSELNSTLITRLQYFVFPVLIIVL
jgi:Sad1 / UNC-like C-terminal